MDSRNEKRNEKEKIDFLRNDPFFNAKMKVHTLVYFGAMGLSTLITQVDKEIKKFRYIEDFFNSYIEHITEEHKRYLDSISFHKNYFENSPEKDKEWHFYKYPNRSIYSTQQKEQKQNQDFY